MSRSRVEDAFINMNNVLSSIVQQCLHEVRQANWSGMGLTESHAKLASKFCT